MPGSSPRQSTSSSSLRSSSLLSDLAAEERQAAAALLALAEEELHAEADPEDGPRRGNALAQLLGDPARFELDGRARCVADTGDDGEGRLPQVVRDDRLRAGALERRADAAEVAGAVVCDGDSHIAPFVEPLAPGAIATRSARPSALKAASAT